MVISRFSVFMVPLDPVRGAEMQKARPCVVLSPDEMNWHLRTVIVAPLTSQTRQSPSRVRVRFAGRDGTIALDQIRTIDKSRLAKRLGQISAVAGSQALAVLREMFAE